MLGSHCFAIFFKKFKRTQWLSLEAKLIIKNWKQESFQEKEKKGWPIMFDDLRRKINHKIGQCKG